jgi:hypothetical protein
MGTPRSKRRVGTPAGRKTVTGRPLILPRKLGRTCNGRGACDPKGKVAARAKRGKPKARSSAAGRIFAHLTALSTLAGHVAVAYKSHVTERTAAPCVCESK